MSGCIPLASKKLTVLFTCWFQTAKHSYKMNFKEHFNIPRAQPVEFMDIPIDGDVLVYIDPFLIANNRQVSIFNSMFLQLTGFFTTLNRTYIVPNDEVQGLVFLDKLHEPNEYHLGHSATNKGRAISDTRATTIYGALRNNRFTRAGAGITNEAHNVLLLVHGIGQDIMSDTIANVCRDILATFTLRQCNIHSIPTEQFRMHYYDRTMFTWATANFDLPSYRGKPIILLPTGIISSPRSYTNRYNWFIARDYIAEEIISGEKPNPNDGFTRTMSDGTKHAIIKRIYKVYQKPKAELVEFVLEYTDSLDRFLDYAREHLPALDL